MLRPSTFSLKRLDGVGEIVEMRVDGERLAIGFERVFVVADILQDEAEAGQRAEVPRLFASTSRDRQGRGRNPV